MPNQEHLHKRRELSGKQQLLTTSAEVCKNQNTILVTSDHRSSTPMVPIDLQEQSVNKVPS